MKTTNPVTQLLVFFGIFLAVFGISRFNGSNFSFENNQRAYYMIIGSAVSLLVSLILLNREKNRNK